MPVDLDAYCARVEFAGPRTPTPSTLRELHRAHVSHIPFEGLDAFLGRPIRLDLDRLEAKLVHSRRGGYCFEQNTLFAAVLEQCGFDVVRLGARVQMGATERRPRTHMVLAVTDRAGDRWLADVGFGGEGLYEPLPLEPGPAQHQGVWRYRLTTDHDDLSLEAYLEGHGRHGEIPGWLELYRFSLTPEADADREVANHFTSTHPHSPFVQYPFAAIVGPEVRRTLIDNTFVERRSSERLEQVVTGPEQIRSVLLDHFGIVLPDDVAWPPANRKVPFSTREGGAQDHSSRNVERKEMRVTTTAGPADTADGVFADATGTSGDATPSSAVNAILGRNAAHVAAAQRSNAAQRPELRLAVLVCMDARIDVAHALGVLPGEVHMLRNAGGSVTDDVLRSLVVSQQMLDTDQVMVIHHTDCGMLHLDEDSALDAVEHATGTRPPFALLGFDDLEASVRADVDRLRVCEFLPHRDQVRGFVFDVELGALREVT